MIPCPICGGELVAGGVHYCTEAGADATLRPPSRWKRNKARWLVRIRRARAALIAALGGECAECTSRDDLQFDHPHGRDWKPSKVNRETRIRLYRRDLAAGNLRLLCKGCNAYDGGRRRHRAAA